MLFSVSVQCPGVTGGNPIAQLRNPNAAGGPTLRLKEFGAFCNAATAASIGLIRALTLGTAIPGNTSLGQALSTDPQVATGLLDFGWSVAPTIPGSPIYPMQAVLQAAQGAGIVWPFYDEPIEVPAGAGLILWNWGVSTTPAMTVYAKWGE
jgi:hypothetical protein